MARPTLNRGAWGMVRAFSRIHRRIMYRKFMTVSQPMFQQSFCKRFLPSDVKLLPNRFKAS